MATKTKAKPKRGRPSNAEKAAQQAEIASRRAKVAALALTYVPQNQIARQLGVSTATVSGDLKAVKAAWLADAKTDVQEAAVMELASLDRLETQLWVQFMSQEQTTIRHYNDEGTMIRQQQVDKVSVAERTRTALAILQTKNRRARMLGFDQPDLLEVRITSQQVQDEIARLRAKHAEQGPHALPA